MRLNFVKGVLIGVANIIPGVSGGTFALILGIYDRLINALGEIDFVFLKGILSPKTFKREFKRIDGVFLVELGIGVVAAIIFLSWAVDYMLKNQPGITLAFFMGLIIPSVAVPYRMIVKKSALNKLYMLPGILLVVAIYSADFMNFELSLPVVFISGALAISAMILPGISGSFLLLVFGVYESVIGNIKAFTTSLDPGAFLFLFTFGIGCVAGLIIFVRLMKVLFNKYPDQTLYFLIGLVLGSIVVLWPFKEYPAGAEKIEIAVTTSKNIFPRDIKSILFFSLFFVFGFLGASGMNIIAKDNNK